MKATIEVPDSVFEAFRHRADQEHSSVEAVILEAIEKEIFQGTSPSQMKHRVRLPLIHSKHPGSLRSLKNPEIDAILD